MFDICLDWGRDLVVGTKGDLALVAGSDQTNQRVLRRLLSNPGDYLWQAEYGGGLALFVGSPTDAFNIEAVIRTQLSLESTVPTVPAPSVTVQILDSANGTISAQIEYSDQTSNIPVYLTVSVK